MGLAERKFKQRIGHDPRNLTWSEDKSRFSYKHMTTLGWADNTGIGKDLSGNPNHIAVARKLDNGGIGMSRARKEGDELASGAGQAGQGLEDVLKRLAQAASPSPSPSPAPFEASAPISKLKNRNPSRQRHLNSKRLAASSPAALAEILGVPISSLPTSPSPALSSSESIPATPAESSTSVAMDERTADEPVSTSTLSVADYFRQKMREKMLARQASSGSVTPQMSEDSLANIKEEKVNVGGVGWQGSKTKFEEVKVEVTELGGDEQVKVESVVVKAEAIDPLQITLDSLGVQGDQAAKRHKKEDEQVVKSCRKAEKATSNDTDNVAVKVERIEETPVASTSVILEGTPATHGSKISPDAVDVTAKKGRKEEKRKRKDDERVKSRQAIPPSGNDSTDGSTKKRKRSKGFRGVENAVDTLELVRGNASNTTSQDADKKAEKQAKKEKEQEQAKVKEKMKEKGKKEKKKERKAKKAKIERDV